MVDMLDFLKSIKYLALNLHLSVLPECKEYKIGTKKADPSNF